MTPKYQTSQGERVLTVVDESHAAAVVAAHIEETNEKQENNGRCKRCASIQHLFELVRILNSSDTGP